MLLLWISSTEQNSLQAAGTGACQRCRKNILEDGLGDVKIQSIVSELKQTERNLIISSPKRFK